MGKAGSRLNRSNITFIVNNKSGMLLFALRG
jgi:hypothetical protein